ncbi:MAG: hypothetical protein NZ893_02630 [Candidatus Aenigmarchaeota archaeon]|nr:hypothetical protein [Candidatus Aenigmarchaeota archaeon]
MKWLETKEGNLINLENVVLIKIEQYFEKYRVVAFLNVSSGCSDNFGVDSETIFEGSEEECRLFMNLLRNKLKVIE